MEGEAMLKVFLVEDEVVVREGLRDTVPWERCGYTFVGSATDGEMALPEIRRLNPDVLITDIRMPFMDGLALSRQVRREMPHIKIIIISGYNNFDYARQAIQIGVEQYLLKPITKASIMEALAEMKIKIDKEQQQQNYYMQFRREAQEYEQFTYHRFFEKLVSGHLSVQEIYEEADNLHININSQAYNIVLYSFQSNDNKASEALDKVQDELTQFLLMCQNFLLFRWGFSTYAVLIKDNTDMIGSSTQFCVDNICRRCENTCGEAGWYVSAGTPVERLSSVHTCFNGVSRKLSYQYLCPGQHVLTDESVAYLFPENEEQKLNSVDVSKTSIEVIQRFLKTGLREEVDDFASEYLDGFSTDALNSVLFSQYTALNFRFAAIAYVKELGIPVEELSDVLETLQSLNQLCGRRAVKGYICALLAKSVELRESASSNQHHALVKRAVENIEQHYTDGGISLGEVAKALNINASYLSSVFSQKVGKTFTEYLTQKRMDKARELLRQTDKQFSEISFEIGYKDPHYFSFLFKKIQGCTPRDYRAGK